VTAERSRVLAAPPAAVWAVVGDPRALPRWWPRTERVEGVRDDAWTTVLRSDRGRVVRADWRLEEEAAGRRRAWRQVVEGTPFEKVLRERVVIASLEPAAGGEETRVTLALHQRARKLGRLGDLILGGGARRELDAALDALAAATEPPAA
jgi:uncharacterized protein YndB with AHSA1/START domain